MHDIRQLEEAWKRYRRKKMRPWIIGGVSLLLLSGASVAFLKKGISLPDTSFSFSFGGFNDENKTVKEVKSPSPKVVAAFVSPALTQLLAKEQSRSSESPLEEVPEEEVDYMSSSPKRVHIEVIDASSAKSSLREIERRFKLAHDTDDSLFLAKSYYKKRWYKKAEYWALQTNKIDPNIEESWLIFASAQAKQGKKNSAISVLNSYIRRRNSAEARVLLQKIKEGRL